MLTTVDEVIETIGGATAVAGIAGVGLPAVSNWRARGKFPSNMFLVVSKVLQENGKTVDPALFGFREPSRSEAAE